MLHRLLLLILTTALLAASCNVKKPIRPTESYENLFETPPSTISIPIDINVAELEAGLNRQLTGILYEDKDYNDGDKMRVRAEKKDDIRLAVDSQAVKYRLPLKLWIKYDIGISKVEAEGDITIDFRTLIDIASDWEVKTTTQILNYEWTKKPRLKMGMVSLPVGFIANLALDNSQKVLTSSIDQLVKDNFNLKGQMEEAWSQMFKPMLVSEEYNTWLTINPSAIGMTPIKMGRGKISSTIFVEGNPKVKVGSVPEGVYPAPLPPLSIKETAADSFILHLKTKISYDEAERLAKQEVVGEKFTQGKRSVTIEDLEFFGQGNKIVVNTVLSGSYNGSIYMTGQPVYNTRKNTIDIEDLEYTLDTENFLFKSAGWLLKSAIKSKVQENLDFLLDYNLNDMKTQFQEQLKEYSVSEGVTVFGELQDINIRNAYLVGDGMIVDLGLLGKVNVKITGLN
jgi:LEA14-like dessication related protein